MRVQKLHSVPFTDVLSRLPDEVDRAELAIFFSEWTDFAYGTNSHSLVPWSVLVEDLTDCCIELGYAAPDIKEIYPRILDFAGNTFLTDHFFVDLEN